MNDAVNKNKEIIVKNAEGYPGTKATIIHQNSINYEPKVSVIIPVYNTEKYLRQCLDSIINQTLKEIEFICVDDGSTDSSLEILKEYAEKDNRFTIIHAQHCGTGICRNLAIEHANGFYLGFVDPDDWIELSYFEKLYNATLIDSPEIVFQTKRIEINDISKKEIHIGTPNGENDIEFRFNIIDKSAHLWSKIFKKEFVEKYQLKNYNSKRSQDLLFTIPAILLAKNIKNIDNAKYYYRKGHHSACQQKWVLKDAIESLNLYEEIRKKLLEFNNNYISLVNLKENILCKKIQKELSKKELMKFNKRINHLHFIDFKTISKKELITIKNPSPDNIKKIWWGDYWLGLDLALGLKTLEYSVITDYSNKYGNQNNEDINIVIRGLFNFNNINPKKINILYQISNPQLITKEELKRYDIVLCSSEKYTKELRKNKKHTYFLPQFTNTERFYYEENDKYKNNILYVGSANRGMRPAVEYAINLNLPISIYGNFWNGLVSEEYIKGLYIDNGELHKYYSNADIILNDTVLEMKEKGFISNRIYDVSACKGFIITDYMPEIEEIFGDAIPMYKNQQELKELVEYYLVNPEERKKKAQKAYEIVINNYTHIKTAQIISKYIVKLRYKKYMFKFLKFLQNIFSVRNNESQGCKWYKVITVFGVKIKFKNKNLTQKKLFQQTIKKLEKDKNKLENDLKKVQQAYEDYKAEQAGLKKIEDIKDAKNYKYSLTLPKGESRTYIYNWIKPSTKVLDLGCACGTLGKLNEDKNCEFTGIEYNICSAEIAKESGVYKEVICGDLNKYKYIDLANDKYDYIIMGDVLEHLNNPQEVLKYFMQYLNDDGSILISLPNIGHASIKANLLTNNFDYTKTGILDETHLRFFTSKTAVKLVSDAGLEIEDCKLTNFKDIYGWQKTNPYEVLPQEIREFILRDKHSSIVQFVFKCKKSASSDLININLEKIQSELDKTPYMQGVEEYLKF